MNQENCLERVVKAIRVCKRKARTIDAGMRLEDDLGIDSFEMLMLIGELEAEFNISIEDADFEGVSTVGDIVRKLEEASC
ncbi:MAG: acyl carrier protein [Azoarcus sp.]|jgi:acyl carrier protein|nr:acyl carrier protein [Azoarcus sp.]